MDRERALLKIITCTIGTIMTFTFTSHPFCLAETSCLRNLEPKGISNQSLNYPVKSLLRSKNLLTDFAHATSTQFRETEVTFIPLVSPSTSSTISNPSSGPDAQRIFPFIVLIDLTQGEYLHAFLEITFPPNDFIPSSITFTFPDERKWTVSLNPFSLLYHPISLSGSSDSTMITLDACDTLEIIAITLAAACFIFTNPILCGIAAIIEAIVKFIC